MIFLTTAEIVDLLQVTRQFVNKQQKTFNWQPTGERVQGGGNKYNIDTIRFYKSDEKDAAARENIKYKIISQNAEASARAALEEFNRLHPLPEPGKKKKTPPALTYAETVASVEERRKNRAARDPEAVAAETSIYSEEFYQSAQTVAASKPQKKRDKSAVKVAAVNKYLDLIHGKKMPIQAAAKIVAAEINVHFNCIRNWHDEVKDHPHSHWLALLTDKHSTKGRPLADCPIKYKILYQEDWLTRAKPSSSACYDRLQRIAKAEGVTLPTKKTFENWMKAEVTEDEIIMAREGEDAFKRTFAPQERDPSVFYALQAVNSDAYEFWPHVDFGDGVIGKAWGHVIQDVMSAKLLACRIGTSESTELIQLSHMEGISKWGLWKKEWFDNTRAAANKTMTGGVPNRFRFKVKEDDVKGILPRLGIEVHFTKPAWGQSKPIERAFGVGGLSEYIDKHPKWRGRGTKEKPIPLDEFKAVVMDEIAAHNERRGRRSAVCNGKSFNDIFNESYAKNAHNIIKPTKEQLRLLMLSCDAVTVNRYDGSITLNLFNGPNGQNRYSNDILKRYAGKKVAVRFDPADLYKSVVCETLDGRFLCEAECLVKAGFNDATAAKEHNRLRAKGRKRTKEELADRKRMNLLVSTKLPPTAETLPEPTNVTAALFGRTPATDAAPDKKVPAAVMPIKTGLELYLQGKTAVTPKVLTQEEADAAFMRGVENLTGFKKAI
jgi:hypothetical protein